MGAQVHRGQGIVADPSRPGLYSNMAIVGYVGLTSHASHIRIKNAKHFDSVRNGNYTCTWAGLDVHSHVPTTQCKILCLDPYQHCW